MKVSIYIVLRCTSCRDLTVKSKFSANRRSYLQCLSSLQHRNKAIPCRLFSDFLHHMQVIYTNKIHLSMPGIKGMRPFFLNNSLKFFFQKSPDGNKNKIANFYSV